MKALSYLKLDLYLAKIAFIYNPIFIGIMIVMFFFLRQPIYALNVMFGFMTAMASMPFVWEAYSKCRQFYYTLPAKNSHMVLGRYLLLCMIYFFVSAVTVISMLCKLINGYGLVILSISAIVTIIFVSIQFPIFYKYGYGKSQAISVFIFIAPAFIILLLPPVIHNYYARLIESVVNNSTIIGLLSFFITVITLYVSYKISCKICNRKDI
jgi:hypothetical protein